MKPVWGHKKTLCYICQRSIDVGKRRLDQTIKTKAGHFITQHYHPICSLQKYFSWWKKHPYEVISRKSLEPRINEKLNSEQLVERKRILSRLGMLEKHYTTRYPIIKDGEISQARLIRYNTKLKEHLLSLIVFGGIPKRYLKLGYTEEIVCSIDDVGLQDLPIVMSN